MFEQCIHEYYLSKHDLVLKQSQKINDNFYISGYSSTEVKIRHIMNICDLLEISLVVL